MLSPRLIDALRLAAVGLLCGLAPAGGVCQTGSTNLNPGAWRVIYVAHEPVVPPSCTVIPSLIIVRQGVDLGKVYACTSAGAPTHIGTLSTSGGGGTAFYSQSFTAETSVLLTHALGTRHVLVSCYDGSDQVVEANTVQIGASAPYNVAVTFAVPQTGRCVVGGSP